MTSKSSFRAATANSNEWTKQVKSLVADKKNLKKVQSLLKYVLTQGLNKDDLEKSGRCQYTQLDVNGEENGDGAANACLEEEGQAYQNHVKNDLFSQLDILQSAENIYSKEENAASRLLD